MKTAPTIHTLLDEWHWRRDRLNREPGSAACFAPEQIKVLDYLIGRYQDSPEALTPVRVRPMTEFHVDQRAIVVHHHLWEGVQNRSAVRYAMFAWRELLGSGRENEAWKVLDRSLAEMKPAAAVAQGLRDFLADSDAQVRLAALDILPRIGTLEDIGLLSDLLALPPAADEHPVERAALLRTMRGIAESAHGS